MGVGEGTARSSSKNPLGSLSNGDGDENGKKKQVGLDWQNNSFARTSSFFVQFVAVIIRLQCESA